MLLCAPVLLLYLAHRESPRTAGCERRARRLELPAGRRLGYLVLPRARAQARGHQPGRRCCSAPRCSGGGRPRWEAQAGGRNGQAKDGRRGLMVQCRSPPAARMVPRGGARGMARGMARGRENCDRHKHIYTYTDADCSLTRCCILDSRSRARPFRLAVRRGRPTRPACRALREACYQGGEMGSQQLGVAHAGGVADGGQGAKLLD